VLAQKLEEFAPRVVAFNGKLPYEQFAQRKCRYGLQTQMLYGAQVYVLPPTSGHDSGNKAERVKHFRSLARLVDKATKAHEAQHA
jgi:hypothetical protein